MARVRAILGTAKPTPPEGNDGWIATSERMPPEWENVLCFSAGTYHTGYWANDHNGWRCAWRATAPTHWRPLPAPPKGEA